jgi:TRAP-type C4-dicarboxylate transport system permease small subunit
MWVTFLGTSWAAREEGYHISMSALVDATPKIFKTNTVKTFILQITYLLTGLFCFYLTFMGSQLTYFSFKGGQTTPGLLIPLWLMYVCFPIGIFLTGVHYLTIFFKHLLGQEGSPVPRELQTELQKEG